MKKYPFWAAPAAAAVFLAACGGGGGGGADDPPKNAPPALSAQTFNGNENATISGQIVATDSSDSLTYAVISSPKNGTLTAFSTGGAFTYRPNAFFVGTDSFSVSVTDSGNNTVVATMSVTLAAVNDPPTANDDVLTVTSASGIDVLANDTDPDNDALKVSIVGTSFPAGATVGADQRVSFPVAAGFKGVVRFNYRVTDGGLTDEASALAFVNVPPMKAVFIGAPAGAQATEDRVYTHDFFAARRVDASATTKVIDMKVARDGRTLLYQQEANPSGLPVSNELYYLDLTQPTQQHRASATLPVNTTVSRVILSDNGRYAVYQLDGSNAAGSAIYRYDTQSPATFAQRISPADTVLKFATAPRFNSAGTVVYYGGRAPGNGAASAWRSNLVTGTPEVVTQLGGNGFRDVGVDFVMPTPDETRVIVHSLEYSFPPDAHDTIYLGNPLTPTFYTLVHRAAPAAVTFKAPMVSPDGLYTVMFGPFVLTLGRSDTPLSETQIGPDYNFAWQFIGTVPDPERVMRADSKAALLPVGCGYPAMFPTVPCDIYELTFADPAAPVRVSAVNTAGNNSTDPAYSADGNRILFLDREGNAKSLAVVSRGAFGTQSSVSAAGQDVVRYQLDASGYVALYTIAVAGSTNQRLFVANADAPGEALELGLVSGATPFQLTAR